MSAGSEEKGCSREEGLRWSRKGRLLATCSVPARTLGDIEKAFGKAPVSLKAPCKGILRPLKGAAPPAARGRGLRRAVGVPQRHPVVLATAGKALASLRGARVPPNRLPLVRRGRPAALTLRRGAGNKGSCVCP